MNAFTVLGLPETLVLSEEQLRDAFRAAGKATHPDAGGNEANFALTREAHGILTSPSRRLRHWLELRKIAVESRGVIGAGLMDIFGMIGTISQRAEVLIRKREEARSALSRAMLESETQVCREEVEAGISTLDDAIAERCERFPEWDAQGSPDAGVCAEVVRDLAFLEKWKLGLRASYSRLV